MSPDSQPAPPLCGHLLLAGPELLESTFRRTVVLIAQHSLEDGALGYILNRPLHKRVLDVLPSEELSGIGDLEIYFGGPVGREHLTFAAIHWDPVKQLVACQSHLSAAQAKTMRSQGSDVRGFIGYSGWAPGQLEGELAAQAWEVQRPDSMNFLDANTAEDLWSRLIRTYSPLHRIAADMPDDLSLN
jgi:putative transcriptional regulator